MDREMRIRRKRQCGRGEGRLVMGLFVICLGVAFLLQNLGLVYVRNVWEFWPVFLIVMGASRAASSYSLSGRVWGGIVAGVGCVFLAQNLGFIPYNAWHMFWPLILIVIGIGMLFRGFGRRWGSDPPSRPPGSFPAGGFGPGGFSRGRGHWSRETVQANVIHEWAIFGGCRRRVESQDFEGGEALAIFGGVEVDLRDANSQKDVVHIEANSMFGGIEIRVPETWNVTVQGQGIFGGYEDETRGMRPNPSGKPQLIVSGTALFGGVNVKN